jgi:hypothetical protein
VSEFLPTAVGYLEKNDSPSDVCKKIALCTAPVSFFLVATKIFFFLFTLLWKKTIRRLRLPRQSLRRQSKKKSRLSRLKLVSAPFAKYISRLFCCHHHLSLKIVCSKTIVHYVESYVESNSTVKQIEAQLDQVIMFNSLLCVAKH